MICFQWLMVIFFCNVIWNALHEYSVSFCGSIDARTWRGYRLYGTRVCPIDNFSLLTGPSSRTNIVRNLPCLSTSNANSEYQFQNCSVDNFLELFKEALAPKSLNVPLRAHAHPHNYIITEPEATAIDLYRNFCCFAICYYDNTVGWSRSSFQQ